MPWVVGGTVSQERECVCNTLNPWSSRMNVNGIRLPGDTQGRGVDKYRTGQDTGRRTGKRPEGGSPARLWLLCTTFDLN